MTLKVNIYIVVISVYCVFNFPSGFSDNVRSYSLLKSSANHFRLRSFSPSVVRLLNKTFLKAVILVNFSQSLEDFYFEASSTSFLYALSFVLFRPDDLSLTVKT